MAEDESGSKGQSKGLPFLYLLTHFEMETDDRLRLVKLHRMRSWLLCGCQ